MKNYKFCIIALLVIYLFILQCEANIKNKNLKGNKEIKRQKRQSSFFGNLLDKPKNNDNLPDLPSTLEKENNFESEINPSSHKFQKDENKIGLYPEPSDNFE
uniref:Fam-c protein n=1 Tax=Meloidogyne floridensis TaxID=298350 RepID=A0A915P0A8_9BILA